MKTDGIFNIATFRILFENYSQPISLAIGSDVHYDSPNHASAEFVEFLDRAQSRKSYLLLNGDTFDGLSTSERTSYARAEFHDQTYENYETYHRKIVDRFSQLVLKRIPSERIIGVGGGNHYFLFKDRNTSEQYLAYLLGTNYLGTMCFLRLLLTHAKSRATFAVDILMHHGMTSGQTLGASLNTFSKMVMYQVADIYLQGHDHKMPVVPFVRLSLNSKNHLVAKKGFCVRTGCFVKTYIPKVQSYEVDRMYPPTVIGGVNIDLTPKDTQNHGVRDKYVDISVTI